MQSERTRAVSHQIVHSRHVDSRSEKLIQCLFHLTLPTRTTHIVHCPFQERDVLVTPKVRTAIFECQVSTHLLFLQFHQQLVEAVLMLLIRQTSILSLHIFLRLQPFTLHQTIGIQVATLTVDVEGLLVYLCLLFTPQGGIVFQETNQHRQHVISKQIVVLTLRFHQHSIAICFRLRQSLHVVQHMCIMLVTFHIIVITRLLIVVGDVRPFHLLIGRTQHCVHHTSLHRILPSTPIFFQLGDVLLERVRIFIRFPLHFLQRGFHFGSKIRALSKNIQYSH